MAKIYVASSWRNDHQQLVVAALKHQGHEVYDFKNPPGKKGFSWSDVDPLWKTWTMDEYRDTLDCPVAIKSFLSDFTAMQQADICVLVMPAGRSASVEAGWMKGAGKKVIVFIPEFEVIEPELMFSMFDRILISMPELTEAMKAFV